MLRGSAGVGGGGAPILMTGLVAERDLRAISSPLWARPISTPGASFGDRRPNRELH